MTVREVPVVDIRSSWTVTDGVVTRFGEQPRHRYSCSACGELGHSTRTCGQSDEQRIAKREAKLTNLDAFRARVAEIAAKRKAKRGRDA